MVFRPFGKHVDLSSRTSPRTFLPKAKSKTRWRSYNILKSKVSWHAGPALRTNTRSSDLWAEKQGKPHQTASRGRGGVIMRDSALLTNRTSGFKLETNLDWKYSLGCSLTVSSVRSTTLCKSTNSIHPTFTRPYPGLCTQLRAQPWIFCFYRCHLISLLVEQDTCYIVCISFVSSSTFHATKLLIHKDHSLFAVSLFSLWKYATYRNRMTFDNPPSNSSFVATTDNHWAASYNCRYALRLHCQVDTFPLQVCPFTLVTETEGSERLVETPFSVPTLLQDCCCSFSGFLHKNILPVYRVQSIFNVKVLLSF